MAGTKEKLAGKAMQWEGKALSTFGRMKDRKSVTVAIAFGLIMTAIAVAAEWRERARPEAGSGPR